MAALLLLIPAVLVALVVHEAGHAAAAQTLRLPWRPTLTWHGPGVTIGNAATRLAPWQLVVTSAAGPAANLLLAAIAYQAGMPLLVLTSLEFAVVNLLPLPHSDGARMLRPRRTLTRARKAAPPMKTNITVAFDELETRIFDTVASPSILCDDSQALRARIVRRAAQGEALSGRDLVLLKAALEGAVTARETLAEDAPTPELKASSARWLAPLGAAWTVAAQAEAFTGAGM